MVDIIWLIFAIIFACLGFYHIIVSKINITPFQISKIHQKKVDVEFVTSLTNVDIEKPLIEFVADFNTYLKDCNKKARRQNLLTAAGYFAACLTALFSMLKELSIL